MGVEYNKIHSTRKLEIKKKIDGEQIYLLFWKKNQCPIITTNIFVTCIHTVPLYVCISLVRQVCVKADSFCTAGSFNLVHKAVVWCADRFLGPNREGGGLSACVNDHNRC